VLTVHSIEIPEVLLGDIAGGGACVARLPGEGSGRVVFVRGGLPGERVRVRLTDTSRKAWWRGEVAEVIEASPDRVTPPCPMAGVCGGCDWQHISLARQRELKARIVDQQLSRLAHVEYPVEVRAVEGDQDGLAWRTRMRYLAGGGRLGLRAAGSHDMAPVPAGGCPLVAPGGPPDSRVLKLIGGRPEAAVTIASSGWSVWSPGGGVLAGDQVVTQHAAGRDYDVMADGFWQVHPGAADALAAAVIDLTGAEEGDTAVDLYCGAGLFAGALAARGVKVRGVEANRPAVAMARRNVPQGEFIEARVERAAWDDAPADIAVLDPPRAGAGADVVRRLAKGRPKSIAYVSCDPASLARDIATFAEEGYVLDTLLAFDAFPMTAHVECVVALSPAVDLNA